MKSHGYEEVAHTADMAIRVWAEDFHSLLLQSAQGMYDVMGITQDSAIQLKSIFRIPDGSLESVLVDFLSELLFLAEVKMEKFDQFAFSKTDKYLAVTAHGYPIKTIRREIKAVTFHNLVITETDDGIMATITFDV